MTFTVNESNAELIALNEGETRTRDYSFRVEYRDAKGVVSAGNVKFTVTFTGKNERPTADVSPDETNPSVADHAEEASRDLTATGTWAFNDADSAAQLQRLSVKELSGAFTQITLDGTATERTVAGKFGSIVINADGTWVYTADAAKLTQIQLHGNQADGTVIPQIFEEFAFQVSDGTVSSEDGILRIAITGTKEAPRLEVRVAPDGGPAPDVPDAYVAAQPATADLETVEIKENTPSDSDYSGNDPAANYADTPNVTGTWMAIDPDNLAQLSIVYSGDEYVLHTAARPDGVGNNIYGGTRLSGTKDAATSVVLVGLYGDLTLHMDGSWEYDIDTNVAGTGRGDRIAHGEQVQDVFNFYVVDGWGEQSNEITLQLNIEGRNDAPQMVSNARTEAGRPVLNSTLTGDGRLGNELDTATILDDIVVDTDGTLILEDGNVKYDAGRDPTFSNGADKPAFLTNVGGVITLTNPAGTDGNNAFTLVRAADGQVTVTFTDDGGTQRSIILRQSNAEIARDNDGDTTNDVGTVIGDVVEDGERWQADGTTSEADGQAGRPTATGKFDAIDPDLFGRGNQESSGDDHVFTLLTSSISLNKGDAAADVDPAIASGGPTGDMALADAAWALFQVKSRADWADDANDAAKTAYTDALGDPAGNATDSAERRLHRAWRCRRRCRLCRSARPVLHRAHRA